MKILDIQDVTQLLVPGARPVLSRGPTRRIWRLGISSRLWADPAGEVLMSAIPSQPVSIGRFDAVGGLRSWSPRGTTVHLAGDMDQPGSSPERVPQGASLE